MAGAAASSAPSVRSTPVLCLPGGPGGQRELLKGALLGAGRFAACGWVALCSQAAVLCFVSQWQRHAGVHSVRTLTPGSRCSEELPRLPPGLRPFSSSALAGLFLGCFSFPPAPAFWLVTPDSVIPQGPWCCSIRPRPPYGVYAPHPVCPSLSSRNCQAGPAGPCGAPSAPPSSVRGTHCFSKARREPGLKFGEKEKS